MGLGKSQRVSPYGVPTYQTNSIILGTQFVKAKHVNELEDCLTLAVV